MIIQTAIPLIAEYGAAVTTAKVARAAGIGEGTIFRLKRSLSRSGQSGHDGRVHHREVVLDGRWGIQYA